MKTVLLILAFFVFPLQNSWAAIEAYCQAEQVIDSDLVHACVSPVDVKSTKEHIKNSGLQPNSECSQCDIQGAQIIGSSCGIFALVPRVSTSVIALMQAPLLFAARPERPQWQRLSI